MPEVIDPSTVVCDLGSAVRALGCVNAALDCSFCSQNSSVLHFRDNSPDGLSTKKHSGSQLCYSGSRAALLALTPRQQLCRLSLAGKRLWRKLISGQSRSVFWRVLESPEAVAIISRLSPPVVSQTLLLGDSCTKSLLDLKAARPVQKGCVQDWDAVGDLWSHTFRDLLKIDPHQQKILVTESPLTPAGHRQRLFEVLFERFGFAAATTQIQAALTLYAQGEATAERMVLCRAPRGITVF